MKTTGSCLCRKTTWTFDDDPDWQCFCHCDDCRRNCAAPVVAWLGAPVENFSWTGQTPKTIESSPNVFRHFCQDCGTPMGFEAGHYPGAMQLYAGSLDDPTQFAPEFHVNFKSKLPWLAIDDDLKKFDSTLQFVSDEEKSQLFSKSVKS